jgi:diguanylate cyclase (GGDEF)-like protein
MAILHTEKDRYFSKADERLLDMLAQHAAIAVENASLYKNARDAADRQAIVHRVSQKFVCASLDSEGIYTAIHKAVAQLMPAEAFVITQLNDEKDIIEAVYLIDRSGRAPRQEVPRSTGLSGRVISTGTSIYIEDTLSNGGYTDLVHFGDPDHVRSILAVPMRLRGKVTGMLSAQSYQPHQYSRSDRETLEMLASYAAIALDNDKLFNHIQHLAITDDVTRLYNRRYLFEMGQREFHRARRFDRPLSVIMLDIDHFKRVNDNYGHAVGDQALQQIAKVMTEHLRQVDILGRYGGEEFTIVLPETGRAQAHILAERLRRDISENFKNNSNGLNSLTVSLGVSELTEDLTSFNSLVQRADAALYDAKHAGRDTVMLR